MLLHIPTLLLALLIGFLLLTLSLGTSQKAVRARPEIRRWTHGCWALLGGFAALAARVVMPLELSVVLGNGLISLGLAMYAQALYMLLCGNSGPKGLMRAQPVIWLMLLLILDWSLPMRTALMSVLDAALLLPSVLVVLRHGWQAEHSLRTVAATMALAIIALLLRAVHALLHPEDYGDLMQTSLGQGLAFLVSFICLLGAGFGFILAVFERVTRQMEVLATHDGLTGCFNRSTTDAMLAHELQRAHRDGTQLAFVLLDLDHFKQVNDRHGHRAGDAVLRAFAEVVQRRLRASDVFGRTGGEEFGLVLPATDAAGARWLVEAVRREVEALEVPSGDGGAAVKVTVSAGVAVTDASSRLSGDRLYGQADQSLYETKRAGRNRVEVYGSTAGASAALPLA